ncbi:MAG: GntR family transcriptional regulator [Armatimonadota bacterium]|nr:GntR family transcriptional regulator [Armatimonadota bacterium]MDR7438918.1 GntR family transcriptional regulator [Armatimonadota bacterium]MDR7562458.1 GntR family transcriptional regulator [Armatimonadota bacterium]MDR7567046.1 GntR family transcriptional regulator [Armatimonadota bacterium]MDR7601171.1 GntR family transcriptional regulator [Armatimonadota bacterium]
MEERVTLEKVIQGLREVVRESSRVPRYERLAAHLARRIEEGVLSPGSALPPEPDLASLLGVSRQTVSQALAALARRGLVRRKRGVGTFVVPPPVEQPLGSLYSLLRTLTTEGRTVSTRLLGWRVTVEDEASSLLTGNPEGLVYELTRLRLVDGEPLALEVIYLPAACAERLPLDRLAQAPLYDLLRERCGIVVTHGEETLQPVALERAAAALLEVEAGAPAFLVERVAYAGPDRPVELRRSLFRGDRYRFRVRLEGLLTEVPDTPGAGGGR